jgi:hypothetical protein
LSALLFPFELVDNEQRLQHGAMRQLCVGRPQKQAGRFRL